ncbi:MAG: zinc dependent phospholipase C family protein [Bacteroidota bacterium]
MKLIYQCKQYLITLLFCLVFVAPTRSFSILAHEAIIDAGWTSHIKPLLLKKYPLATPEELEKAHAYAYGGCLVADMGYMPFGCPYFTNLLHYVRSGDFIMQLLNDAQNLNEYAFALGAVSHYMADKYGHQLATNLSVGIANPKLKKQFGDVVTYDNDHTSHSSMEFAYDVIQTVKGNYASTAYHNFIGFNMATPLVKRAFLKIYGQDLNTIFPNFESAINTFRWGVRDFFPELANVAWKSDKAGIKQSGNAISRKTFAYTMPQSAFDKKFGTAYQHPGIMARLLAHTIQRLPKIGFLKKMGFKYPGVKCEELFLKSMDSIMVNYTQALNKAGQNQLMLVNIDFDTGKMATVCEYALADMTYKEWVARLQNDQYAQITPTLKQNIVAFYSNTYLVNLMVNCNDEDKKPVDDLAPKYSQNLKGLLNYR